MTKAELRSQFLARRRALSAEDVARQSQTLTDQFFSFPAVTERLRHTSEQNAHLTIHTFLPIGRQNEVDTWPIIHQLWRGYSGIEVAVSVTDTATNRLTHFTLTATTVLVENHWGILQPVSTGKPIQPSEIDVVVVPLLAFDRQGHRVGYGKGYYDRFLAECRPNCLKVGLSFFEPVESITDTDLSDIRLNLCLTPNNSFSFD